MLDKVIEWTPVKMLGNKRIVLNTDKKCQGMVDSHGGRICWFESLEKNKFHSDGLILEA